MILSTQSNGWNQKLKLLEAFSGTQDFREEKGKHLGHNYHRSREQFNSPGAKGLDVLRMFGNTRRFMNVHLPRIHFHAGNKRGWDI